jgi:hypothetical protein
VIKGKAEKLKSDKSDALKFVKSLPLFASVPVKDVEEWFAAADPLKIMTLARDFSNDMDGLAGVDVGHDFGLYIEDKLPRIERQGGPDER